MTIRKTGGKFRVVSKTGKNLGESSTRAGAEKRLGEVEFFKRKSGHKSGHKSRHKSGHKK